MPADSAQLCRSVLAALAYFDVFDFPLTLAEIARFMPCPPDGSLVMPSLAEIRQALASMPVGVRDGFYFLTGREAIVARRQERYLLSAGKFRKARRLVSFLGLIPSVRLIAVCNSLAFANADRDSDIDLFIVTRPGTIWLTRLLATGAVALLGERPDSRTRRDRFCLSFFLAENALDISGLALPDGDTYLPYWLATLFPLHDAGGVLDALLAANSWVGKRLPWYGDRFPAGSPTPFSGEKRGLTEAWAKRLQQKMFPPEISALANRDSRVVVTDDILKFHVKDRRAEIERGFRERLAGVGIIIPSFRNPPAGVISGIQKKQNIQNSTIRIE